MSQKQMLIDAAANIPDNFHLAVWAGFAFIGVSIALALMATGLSIAKSLQLRKFYQRNMQLNKHLPYPMPRRAR